VRFNIVLVAVENTHIYYTYILYIPIFEQKQNPLDIVYIFFYSRINRKYHISKPLGLCPEDNRESNKSHSGYKTGIFMLF